MDYFKHNICLDIEKYLYKYMKIDVLADICSSIRGFPIFLSSDLTNLTNKSKGYKLI